MQKDDVMLTTVDNPYSPFTHWEEWVGYDQAAGHHSLALLGRVVVVSDELSEADQELAITDAMNEIVRENVSGVHVLVTKNLNVFRSE